MASSTSSAAIKALSADASRLLTATQVITSPLSAVKELLDNALDARATSVSIEIAANTLDVIQVRDNGHGIAPDDRGLCCKRHTTSKLVAMSELTAIGGTSLGFRGEALFAIAQVAGSMSVSTRIEGDSAAVKMNINRVGDVAGRATASHAVGTTVRVVDFFHALPVRRQTAEKNASKCLAGIRKMLQAYALARPHVRIMMRMLKVKSEKMNFQYAPNTREPGVKDAACKIVGKDAGLQCEYVVLDSRGFTLQALLPKPDALLNKISGFGHFLSIDQRPVTTTRGLCKQVAKRITQRFRGRNGALRDAKDPFWVMDVSCPQSSYDPNVEPAKDDVLFDDGDELLRAIDELLAVVYVRQSEEESVQECDDDVEVEQNVDQNSCLLELHGDEDDCTLIETTNSLGPHLMSRQGQEQDGRSSDTVIDDRVGVQVPEVLMNTNELELLEARANARQSSGDSVDDAYGDARELNLLVGEDPSRCHVIAEEHMLSQQPANIWRSSMYGCDEDDLDLFDVEQSQRPTNINDQVTRADTKDLNPWTIARMNARLPQRGAGGIERASAGMQTRARSVSPSLGQQMPVERHLNLPAPISSEALDLPAYQSSVWHDEQDSNTNLLSDSYAAPARPQRTGFGGLPTPTPSSSPGCLHSPQRNHPRAQKQRQSNIMNKPFVQASRVLARNEVERPFVSDRQPTQSQKPRRESRDIRDVLRGRAEDAHDISLVPQGKLREAHSGEGSEETDVLIQLAEAANETSPDGIQMEDDFRARLRAAGDTMSSPYGHRLLARHPAHPVLDNTAPYITAGWTHINAAPPPVVEDSAQNQVLKRRRTTDGRRSKSSRLPLEQVPSGYEVQDVVQNLTVTFGKLETIVENVVFVTAEADSQNCGLGIALEGVDTGLLTEMSIAAGHLLRRRVTRAEQRDDEATVLALVSTLARLGRCNEVAGIA